jgi:hypothetical protein
MYWVDVITGAVPLVAGLAGMHAARVRFRRRTTVAGQSSRGARGKVVITLFPRSAVR